MIVIPAIDLREGACVQLVGGRYENERVRIPDPLEVARNWRRAGFRRLHVVDLDAVTARGSNAEVMRSILAEPGIEAQAGGGVRSIAAIGRLLEEGARAVVVGTRAIEEPEWLAEAAAAFPGRLVVAADVEGRALVTRGWQWAAGRDVIDAVTALNALPLAGLLVTAVHREGRMEGTDMKLMRELLRHARLPVLASGGITEMPELRSLAEIGVHGAVLGMALYTGALDARAIVAEFTS